MEDEDVGPVDDVVGDNTEEPAHRHADPEIR